VSDEATPGAKFTSAGVDRQGHSQHRVVLTPQQARAVGRRLSEAEQKLEEHQRQAQQKN
jgi:F420-0:gamma-glutamyl ligase